MAKLSRIKNLTDLYSFQSNDRFCFKELNMIFFQILNIFYNLEVAN